MFWSSIVCTVTMTVAEISVSVPVLFVQCSPWPPAAQELFGSGFTRAVRSFNRRTKATMCKHWPHSYLAALRTMAVVTWSIDCYSCYIIIWFCMLLSMDKSELDDQANTCWDINISWCPWTLRIDIVINWMPDLDTLICQSMEHHYHCAWSRCSFIDLSIFASTWQPTVLVLYW